jgi:hypothetical protein
MPMVGRQRRVFLAAFAFGGLLACGRPFMANDGTVVFQEKGAHGAAVVTANGLEYHDRKDVPQRLVVRDPSDPWHAPIGFILPANGRFTKTSRPTLAATTGLAFAMRPSDTRVPSWGGEAMVRVDVLAPAAQGSARDGEQVAIVLDGDGPDTMPLVEALLGQLGGRDHVTVLDGRGAKLIVPTMPASHRSLSLAAIAKRLGGPRSDAASPQSGAPTPAVSAPTPSSPSGGSAVGLAAAIARAHTTVGKVGARLFVLFSDGRSGGSPSPDVERQLAALPQDHISVVVVATNPDADLMALDGLSATANATLVADAALDARADALRVAVPAPGLVVYRDVVLTFEGTPAPSHVLEASGGEVRWRLESGELALGDVYAGQMRTEVVRVTVPAWVPGEQFKFTVTAHVNDVARSGERREFSAVLPMVYDDDIERIANSRHGDVISYASALATLKRLDAAFVGPGVAQAGGLRKVALMHAHSMTLLARDMHDPQIQEQAELLNALLAATAE